MAVLALATIAGCMRFAVDPHSTPNAVKLRGGEARVPMRVVAGAPLVEVTIGGKGPYWFLVDTGSQITVVDRRVASEAGLRPRVRTLSLDKIAGEAASRDLRRRGFVRVPTLKLSDGSYFDELDAHVHSTEPLAKALAHPVDGVLGRPLIARARFTLDYGAGELVVDREAGRMPDGRNVFRVTQIGGLPSITAAIGAWLVTPVIDTGSQAGLSLGEADADGVKYLEEPEPFPIDSARLGGQVARAGRVSGIFRLGAIQVEDPVALIGGNTHLGGEFLRQFSITVDLRDSVRTIAFDPAGDVQLTAPLARREATPAADDGAAADTADDTP